VSKLRSLDIAADTCLKKRWIHKILPALAKEDLARTASYTLRITLHFVYNCYCISQVLASPWCKIEALLLGFKE